jgi:hypothetical protein
MGSWWEGLGQTDVLANLGSTLQKRIRSRRCAATDSSKVWATSGVVEGAGCEVDGHRRTLAVENSAAARSTVPVASPVTALTANERDRASGTATTAARCDHVHQHPGFQQAVERLDSRQLVAVGPDRRCSS